MDTIIPKVLFQTSIKKPEQYIVDKFTSNMNNEWKYCHFNDEEIIDFFKKNYLEEFSDIIAKFNSMPKGAHKADLFRYYYIYVKGGVYVDSDAMITVNIDEIVKDYSFFSVQGGNNGIFQGLIGACPKNEIIYKALLDAYNINIELLSKIYLLLCYNLHKIIHDNSYNFKYKLYHDKKLSNDEYGIYDGDKLILIHYCTKKIIPR
jgi:mannosyltransferase OCH1-like enzyme